MDPEVIEEEEVLTHLGFVQRLHFEALACYLDVYLIAYELTSFLWLLSSSYTPHTCKAYSHRCMSHLVQGEDAAVQ